jgi:hypothetical protein
VAKKRRILLAFPLREASAVRVIFAAWIVLALVLLGLGQLTTARDREAAPRRASAAR